MHNETIVKWQHSHIFKQDQIKSGEHRTLFVIIITGLMMLVEIIAGMLFGSMALTADGIHMGSHMLGLGITFLAYIYARKFATDQRFSFGTGKVNALAGYSSALVLVFIALFMGYESIGRIINPVEIQYNQAIIVAVIGLVINGVSMLILGEKDHAHITGDNDHHGHDHSGHVHHMHNNIEPAIENQLDQRTVPVEDHNLKAAYLHVLADALTSVLAIFALLTAKYFTLIWMDPVMGILGALLVVRWSIGLVKGTTKILLDYQSPFEMRKNIIEILEGYKDTKVSDLHIWSIGPGIYSSEICIVTKYPDAPNDYKNLISRVTGIVHSTIEIHKCPS